MDKVNILGQDYEIVYQTEAENPKLETANGLMEGYSKQIVINADVVETKKTVDNFQALLNKVLRHEIIHAFFFEMGLGKTYGYDEELVDLLAHQIPKMSKVFAELEI